MRVISSVCLCSLICNSSRLAALRASSPMGMLMVMVMVTNF
jgi:hypothetical protein